jgi:hypothetical protein
LLNPRQSWAIVIIVAGLGFLNYVLLRLFANRGLYYTAGLGGLVNSTATVAELSRLLTGEASSMAVALVLITSVAMFLRNLLILAIFVPAAVPIATAPILAMTVIAAFFAWRRRERGTDQVNPLHVSSPVSLKYVLKFAGLFVLMEIIGTIGARFLGKYGFLALSLLGGTVSSASTTAAAATMAIHGKLSADVAGVATVFASITSALVNLPLVERQTREQTGHTDSHNYFRVSGCHRSSSACSAGAILTISDVRIFRRRWKRQRRCNDLQPRSGGCLMADPKPFEHQVICPHCGVQLTINPLVTEKINLPYRICWVCRGEFIIQKGQAHKPHRPPLAASG